MNMQKMKSAIHKTMKNTFSALVRRESEEWPPYTCTGMYQPHRPEKKSAMPEQPLTDNRP